MALKQILEEKHWTTYSYLSGPERLSSCSSISRYFINNKPVTEEEFRKQEKRKSLIRKETIEEHEPIIIDKSECEPSNRYTRIKRITQYVPLF